MTNELIVQGFIDKSDSNQFRQVVLLVASTEAPEAFEEETSDASLRGGLVEVS